MATENLTHKIDQMKSMIANLEVQLYLQQLMIDDAAQSSGDKGADDRLKGVAREAKINVAMFTRQLDVRRATLAGLEKEQAETEAQKE